MNLDSFHSSNYGKFGSKFICDYDGYVHLTTESWLAIGVDKERADTFAYLNREKLKEAEENISNWRKNGNL